MASAKFAISSAIGGVCFGRFRQHGPPVLFPGRFGSRPRGSVKAVMTGPQRTGRVGSQVVMPQPLADQAGCKTFHLANGSGIPRVGRPANS